MRANSASGSLAPDRALAEGRGLRLGELPLDLVEINRKTGLHCSLMRRTSGNATEHRMLRRHDVRAPDE